jgi:hypothetical protein
MASWLVLLMTGTENYGMCAASRGEIIVSIGLFCKVTGWTLKNEIKLQSSKCKVKPVPVAVLSKAQF